MKDAFKYLAGAAAGAALCLTGMLVKRHVKTRDEPIEYDTENAVHDTNPILIPDDVDWSYVESTLEYKSQVYGFCSVADLLTLAYGYNSNEVMNAPFLGDYKYGWKEKDLASITYMQVPGTPGTLVFMPKISQINK